ncbi:hypothetical protein TNCV_1317581 [Trichonephila clavipes]|nr:hypothetical protein TNCV_1317581 [Trichonephila clavipes]
MGLGGYVIQFGDFITLGNKFGENMISTRNHREGFKIDPSRYFPCGYIKDLETKVEFSSEKSSVVCIDCDKRETFSV